MAGKKVQVLEVGKLTRFTSEMQPGNRGRKPGVPNSATRLRRFLHLIQYTENLVTGRIEELTILEQMDLALIAKALKGNVAAYSEILDRLEGKPKQNKDPIFIFSNPDQDEIRQLIHVIPDLERDVV